MFHVLKHAKAQSLYLWSQFDEVFFRRRKCPEESILKKCNFPGCMRWSADPCSGWCWDMNSSESYTVSEARERFLCDALPPLLKRTGGFLNPPTAFNMFPHWTTHYGCRPLACMIGWVFFSPIQRFQYPLITACVGGRCSHYRSYLHLNRLGRYETRNDAKHDSSHNSFRGALERGCWVPHLLLRVLC